MPLNACMSVRIPVTAGNALGPLRPVRAGLNQS
jgi:hypothetical protein